MQIIVQEIILSPRKVDSRFKIQGFIVMCTVATVAMKNVCIYIGHKTHKIVQENVLKYASKYK